MPINRILTSQQDVQIAVRQLDDEISKLRSTIDTLQAKISALKSGTNGSGSSGSGAGNSVRFAGDLTGTPTSQTVVGIQGDPISQTQPANGQVLQYNGSQWVPATVSTGGTVTFAGDLSGSSTFQTVIGLQGKPISSTAPITNQLLDWNGTNWAPSSDLNLPGNLTINGGAIFNQGLVAHPAVSVTNADASSRILLDFDSSNNPQIDVNGGDGNLHIADPVIVNGPITATTINTSGSITATGNNCVKDSAGHQACFYIDPNWVTNYYFPSFNASGGAQASFVFHDNVLANGSIYSYGNNITVKASNNSGVQSLSFIANDPNNSNLPSLTPAIAGQQLQQLNLGLYLKGNPGTLTTDGNITCGGGTTISGTSGLWVSSGTATFSGGNVQIKNGQALQIFTNDNSQNSSFRFVSGQPLFSSTTGWIQTDCNWNFGGPAGNQAIFGANVPVTMQNTLTVSGLSKFNSDMTHANNTNEYFYDPTNTWYAYQFQCGPGGNFNFLAKPSSGGTAANVWNCTPGGAMTFMTGTTFNGPITIPNYINIQSQYALRVWDSTNAKYQQFYCDANGNGNITGNSGTTLIVQNLVVNGTITGATGISSTGRTQITGNSSDFVMFNTGSTQYLQIFPPGSPQGADPNFYSTTGNIRFMANINDTGTLTVAGNTSLAGLSVSGATNANAITCGGITCNGITSNGNMDTAASGQNHRALQGGAHMAYNSGNASVAYFNCNAAGDFAVTSSTGNAAMQNVNCTGITSTGGNNFFAGWGIKTTGIDATNVFGWLWNGSVNCYVNNSNVGKIQMQASEREAKQDVKPFTRSLEVIRNLEPCSWKYKGFWGGRGDTHVGLMADDAEKVLPEMVTHEKTRIEPEDEEEKDVRFLNPYVLIYVLLNAVKDLDKKVSQLELKAA